jgi:hypothetical protein
VFVAGAALVLRQRRAIAMIITLIVPVFILLLAADGVYGRLADILIGALLCCAIMPRLRKSTERRYCPDRIPSEMIV